MNTTNYYPAGPANIPAKLTALTSSYQLRAFLAILSIILFFLLYFALVAFLGYMVYYGITYEMTRFSRVDLFLKVIAIAAPIMLFIFTLKFIFKLRNHKPENRIKLQKDEHPELWAFVDQICAETGAPKPRSIYIDPDVNAYVSYTNSWLSLIFPVKKELTIGLGLVSCVSLSEFKAVIAHEFGHFAQRSMKIGNYIMSANTIIHDMIFTRDRWDRILEQWRSMDIRLSAPAWVITPVIWLIRQILSLFYQFLNIMYSSLSREMEFNADKVAVSVSGSEAIISALWRLDDGSTNWNDTVSHAFLASQKNLFVKNLYQHNALAMERSSEKLDEDFTRLPEDPRGGKKFFSSSENSKVGMYASHPPNDQRENNAKAPYVECKVDDRSPWLLIGNAEKIQEQMTGLIYEKYLGKIPEAFISEMEFEAFVKAESEGKDLLEEYQNTFRDRFINIPTRDELEKTANEFKPPYVDDIAKLKTHLTELMEPVREIEQLMLTAQQIAEGTTKQKSFFFNDIEYNKKDLQYGYNALFSTREQMFKEKFWKWDAAFCGLHYAMARNVSREEELLHLYQQHSLITEIYRAVVDARNSIYERLQQLQSRDEVEEVEVIEFGTWANDTYAGLSHRMEKLQEHVFVPLPNIDTREELAEALTGGVKFAKEPGPIMENGGFNLIINNMEAAISHCQRVDQKSMAVILTLHKSLVP